MRREPSGRSEPLTRCEKGVCTVLDGAPVSPPGRAAGAGGNAGSALGAASLI